MVNASYTYDVLKEGEHIFTGKNIPQICSYLNDTVYNNDFYTRYMILNYLNKSGAKHQHGFKNIKIIRTPR